MDRAFALLSAFDAGHRSLSLGELSRRSGIPTSSTLRLAGRLMAWGALPDGPDASQVATGLIAVMDGLQKQWLLDEAFDMRAAFDAHLLAIGAHVEREG